MPWEVTEGFWNFGAAPYVFMAVIVIIDIAMIVLNKRSLKKL
jgi:hypothetical protein